MFISQSFGKILYLGPGPWYHIKAIYKIILNFRSWCKWPAYLWSRFVIPYQGILLLCFILAFLVIFSTVLGALPSRVGNFLFSGARSDK